MNEARRKTLGSRVRSLRQEQDISPRELAKAIGISPGYLLELEQGEAKSPSTQVLQKVADGLNVPVSTLLGEESVAPAPTGRLPASLVDFIEDARRRHAPIPECDVQMLLGIRYRGRQPVTVDDWALLYSVIKRTC